MRRLMVGCSALIYALLPGAVAAQRTASQFTVVVSLHVAKGIYTVQAHTRIGSDCAASALYQGSPTSVPIGVQHHVGSTGIVTWQWKPQTAATLAVACTWKSQIAQAVVAAQPATPPASARPSGIFPANPPVMGTGHVIIAWKGKESGTGFADHSPTFTVRGTFHAWIEMAAVNPAQVATADGPSVYNLITTTMDDINPQAVAGPVAIDVHGAPVTYQNLISDLKCQFGCELFMASPANLQWTAVVEQ